MLHFDVWTKRWCDLVKRAIEGFFSRQKARFLRPADRRGSVYMLVVGFIFAVPINLFFLSGNEPVSAIWSSAFGGAAIFMGLSGRMPGNRRRATVALRATSAMLFLIAFPIYAVVQVTAGWTTGYSEPLESWFILVGYFVFAVIVPLSQLLGHFGGGWTGERRNNSTGEPEDESPTEKQLREIHARWRA